MQSLLASKLVAMLVEFGNFWRFVWGVAANWIVFPRQGKATAARARIWVQMYEIGTKSVPVLMITGAFVGMTLAVQSYSQLEGLGLQDRLGVLINLTVVKELGPVLAAIMLAGRVGGALTAELGTMRVTEQIDAIRAMGTDPVRYLVWPRFLACVLLTPVLTVYTDIMGVLGGYFISVWHFGVNSQAYWYFSAEGVENWDILVGVLKSVFFGAAIALISCFKGFNCTQGAQGVGRACTEAFVYSFIAILTLDFILAVITRALYETFWEVRILI